MQGFAVPLEDLVSSSLAQRLRSRNDLIIETHFNNTAPILLPQNSDLRRNVTSARNALNPNILVESLYLYKKPERFHTSTASWNLQQRAAIFNQTLALSTLTGVQYHSSSRDERRTFYEYSSVIDGPQTKRPIPDPVFVSPVSTTLYARQRDLTFGDNIYRYDYTVARDAVIFSQVNETTLSIGIIPVIGKGNLRSVMAIIDCGDSILIYAVSMVNSLSVPGLRDRIGSSFGSRADALLKWFAGRLDSELFS